MIRFSHLMIAMAIVLLLPLGSPCFATTDPGLRVEQLDNGMTIVLKEDHSRPVVAVCTYVNGGGRTESDELKGLSHYYEHIIFRGGTEEQEEWVACAGGEASGGPEERQGDGGLENSGPKGGEVRQADEPRGELGQLHGLQGDVDVLGEREARALEQLRRHSAQETAQALEARIVDQHHLEERAVPVVL